MSGLGGQEHFEATRTLVLRPSDHAAVGSARPSRCADAGRWVQKPATRWGTGKTAAMNVGARGEGRVWSWAASGTEADVRREDANKLVGQRIQAVRYFTLDYRRHELHPELIDAGPRTIDAESEWTDPTWLYDGFDAVDYGLEVTTESGATFSLTWDPPGDHEGIGLQPLPMLGSGVRNEADVAIWAVGNRAASWTPMVGELVTGVDLHYVPWDEERGSLWCPNITFHNGHSQVEVVMGDSQDGVLVPSADNVAVLHQGTRLPAWLGMKD